MRTIYLAQQTRTMIDEEAVFSLNIVCLSIYFQIKPSKSIQFDLTESYVEIQIACTQFQLNDSNPITIFKLHFIQLIFCLYFTDYRLVLRVVSVQNVSRIG